MIETPVPRPRFESMRCCHKRKAPLPEASSSIGAAYRIPRIRCADPHRLRPPAGALARGLKTLRVFFTPAPRPRFESMRCCHKRKSPRCRRLSISIGAAYRIRTYDVLIRSQTLYPAEVTPQRKIYKTTLAYWSQAQSQTFFVERSFVMLLRIYRRSLYDRLAFRSRQT